MLHRMHSRHVAVHTTRGSDHIAIRDLIWHARAAAASVKALPLVAADDAQAVRVEYGNSSTH